MGFFRQEYWSGLLFPSPGDLSDPGIEARSPALQADSLLSELPGKPYIYPYSIISQQNTSKGLSFTEDGNCLSCLYAELLCGSEMLSKGSYLGTL